jgi:serine/threonine protein kinase/WD40 repeat protein
MTEETLFDLALEKHTPAERAAFLAESCGSDTALRLRVEALLQSHQQAGFLQTPAIQRAAEELRSDSNAAGAADGETPPLLDFLAPSDKPGSLGRLAHYEIREIVGQGGMGIVLKAFDEMLHRVVAIKVMAGQLAANATARRRFIREARAAAAVSDEHVVTIHAVEEADGIPYLVMQYVAGVSLQDRLECHGPPELPEILRIGIQTASGLAAAHAQGLIHRDIKPANILLENGVERVKITDFGLARAAADASVSQSGVVAGTPNYMSPEQARGEAVDQRSDLFSLGSVLYALCTGRPPFRANSTVAVLKRVCEETPTPIRDTNPEIPNWLAAIIETLHAKDPAERYQSAAEVAELLSHHLAHLQNPSVSPLPRPVKRGTHTVGKDRFRGHGRNWHFAAALLMSGFCSLSLTEATGVTRLAVSVIRILTPDGSLVVEVDDPAVSVTIEGDGGLVISGAGLHSVQLRPGSYRLRAAKDGKPVRDEVVTITRGEKQVVKVSVEPPVKAAATMGGGTGLIRTFTGHTQSVNGVAFTPSGNYILSASGDSSVRVWDVASGEEKQRFEGHRGSIRDVALDPKGIWAISVAGNRHHQKVAEWTVCMWEIATGKELHRLSGRGPSMMSVAVSRDGRQALFGNYDGTVWLYDVENWRELRRLNTHPGHCSVALSPNGKHLLTAAFEGQHSSFMTLWNLETGTEDMTFDGIAGAGRVVFTPDGKQIVSSGSDCVIRVWDAGTAIELGRLRGHLGGVTAVAISADGRWVVSGSYDKPNTVRLWDLEKRTELRRFEGHTNGVQGVAISPDGRFAVSGSHDYTIRLWQLRP